MSETRPGSDVSDAVLIDCGGGRRLERFAGVTVIRPALAATQSPYLLPDRWRADLVFDRDSGWRGAAPEPWRVTMGRATMALRPASAGQLGIFPEHYSVYRRIHDDLGPLTPPSGGWHCLNLFAHTGLVTLNLAAHPAITEVVHVDAAPAAVRQARGNAELSRIDRTIRWLVDDAMGFVQREARRGRRYHIIVADPPAFGRSKQRGAEWKLDRDLPSLLAGLSALLDAGGRLYISCHSAGVTSTDLERLVRAAFPRRMRIDTTPLALFPESGAPPLPCGWLGVAQPS